MLLPDDIANPLVCTGSADCPPAKRLRQPTIAQTPADKKATDMVVAEFFYGLWIALWIAYTPCQAKVTNLALQCPLDFC